MKNWDQHESEMKIELLRTDLAACEATLEHTSGYLGQEIEENAKLRAEIERLLAAMLRAADRLPPNAACVILRAALGGNEQYPPEDRK